MCWQLPASFSQFTFADIWSALPTFSGERQQHIDVGTIARRGAQVERAMLQQSLTLPSILRSFGVPRDGVLIVHAAIATLSHQGVRAEELVESLLDTMADGNVFMPTMTWRTITPAHPTWDEMETPSHTGVLSEIFRTRYSTARSIHPTHSVAGSGPDAAMVLSRHHLDIKPVSASSPYGLLRD